MTPDAGLYLFRDARRPLHLQENLRLLAAGRGTVIELAWPRSDVAPEYDASGSFPRGTRVVLLITEPPYLLFVPVREGEVVEAEHEQVLLRLRIRLGAWVGAGGGLRAFAQRLKDALPRRVPGEKFVVRAPDDGGLIADEEAAWHRAVDDVIAMSRDSDADPYRASVFFRPVGVRLGGGDRLAPRWTPLEPGTAASLVLRFHNPHLPAAAVARHRLRVLAPDDSLVVRGAPDRFPATGDVEVEIEAVGDAPELTVQIAPAPAEHTSVTERFAAPGTSPRLDAAAAPDAHASREELMRLYGVVRRNARFEQAADELDVFDAFARLLPGEQRIVEDRALTLCHHGDADEGYRVLRVLDPALLADAGRFALFRLTLQREPATDPMRLARTLDLAAEGRFARFLDELDRLDPPSLARLLPGLASELPAEQLRSVMDRAGPRLDSAEAIARTAEALCRSTGDAAWAYQYVSDRRQALGLNEPVLIDALLELSAASGRGDYDPGLAEDVTRRIADLVGRDHLEPALALLRKTQQGLGRAERDRLYHRVADRLAHHSQFEAAAGVMVELAYAACETGDLDEATAAAQRARGLWARVGATPPDWLARAIERVEAAWRGCRELAEWRNSEEERRRTGGPAAGAGPPAAADPL